jgi:predicted Zn-dependent protease
MRALILLLTGGLALAGCAPLTPKAPGGPVPLRAEAQAPAHMAVANFVEVVERVEPVAERVCREETPDLNCDFQIVVERDPAAGVNAFHTVTPQGQPLIIYTLGLIATARNTDELAFVMGHEAGHHIARHLPQRRIEAEAGARVFAEWARRQGGSPTAIGEAAQVGSIVASRHFGQRAELEADVLGTVIAYRAGYDPEQGAAFFARIPEDPAHSFLSSHPPNAARIDVVRRTVARLRDGGP